MTKICSNVWLWCLMLMLCHTRRLPGGTWQRVLHRSIYDTYMDKEKKKKAHRRTGTCLTTNDALTLSFYVMPLLSPPSHLPSLGTKKTETEHFFGGVFCTNWSVHLCLFTHLCTDFFQLFSSCCLSSLSLSLDAFIDLQSFSEGFLILNLITLNCLCMGKTSCLCSCR